MSTLIFPSSPYNGQVYPEQPIPGVKQYQYNAQADTWELTAGEGPCICLPANNVILDNIAESFDGINTTFGLTLSGSLYEPPNAAQMIVTVGNIMQEAFVEYTIAGATITFTTAPEAGLDCILLVLAGGQEAPASNLLLDDIQSGFNGTTSTFLLKYETEPYTPINEEQLIVNLDGVQQKPGENYTVSSDTITFTTPPEAGLECFIIALYGGGFGAPGGGGPSTFLIDTDNNIWSCNTAITPDGAYNNFLVGECAGANLTGATTYNNTFIGNYAGFCAGTVSGNYVNDHIFIGDRSGECFTSGWGNIFIGKCSGCGATGGLSNNFIGSYTGQNNTTGVGNNFIGILAGNENLTGTANNFIGLAGRCNTSGSCNNFVGYCTGNFNTTGNLNTFVGTETGYCNTTGICNSFFGGNSAGRYNTTGSCNLYLGNFRGSGFGTCNQHIFISDGAGCNRLMFNSSGAMGVAGTNFGTAGQVLTSCGNALAPVWTTVVSGGGTVTSVATGTGLTGGPITSTGTINLANTAVTAGSYTRANITVDAQGRITSASNGSSVTSVATGTGLTGGPITATGTISLANTAVTPASYTNANITVDAQGRITSASNGSSSGGTVTSVATGTGLSGGPVTSTGTISLANTAVTPASYTNANITVDAQGRITTASNGTAGTVTSVATGTGLTGGPVTATGTISLANTAVTPGSYTYASITVDAQGRLTSASSGTTPLLSSSFTAKGNLLVGTAASSFTALAVGSNGQVLAVDSSTASGVTWANTGSTVISRSTSSVTLNINSGVTATGNITLPRTAIVLSINLDNSVWFRLYNSAAASAADAARAQGTDPAAGSGVLAEIITTSSGTTNFTPVPTAANMESPTTTTYPVRITNNGASGDVTATITYLTLEN